MRISDGSSDVFSSDLGALATKAEAAEEERKKAKHVLKYGSVFRKEHTLVQRAGVWEFARDLEARTDGAIRVELLHGNSVCADQVCIQKSLQGVLDMSAASTQNASGIVPWPTTIEFPYMFQSNGQLSTFFFTPQSKQLFHNI